MKAFDKIMETVVDPKFIRGAQTVLVVGATAITAGIVVYVKGYIKGSVDACACVDAGFRAADPEAYKKLVEKANTLIEAGVIR